MNEIGIIITILKEGDEKTVL